MNDTQSAEFIDDDYFVEDHIMPKLMVVGDPENEFAPLVGRLKTLNIEVHSVESAKAAVTLAREHDYFLILMGAQELRHGGIETAFALRADDATRNTPVVFISSVDKQHLGDAEESYGYGIAGSDYVIHSVHPDVVQREVAVFLDLYREKKALEFSEQLYKNMATRDPLTLLSNREQFEVDLKKALANAKRHGYMIAVLFLDLDKFKPVNDTYGHKVGDEVLQQVADRLKSCTREGDFIARLGGDEFGILLNVIRDGPSAGMVARKLIDILSDPFKLKSHTVTIGASVGIACYPDHGEDHETLLHNADMAMYRAKRAGHNDYRYFGDD